MFSHHGSWVSLFHQMIFFDLLQLLIGRMNEGLMGFMFQLKVFYPILLGFIHCLMKYPLLLALADFLL